MSVAYDSRGVVFGGAGCRTGLRLRGVEYAGEDSVALCSVERPTAAVVFNGADSSTLRTSTWHELLV